MIDSATFGTDDYESIQQQYFSDLRENGQLDADPSGWLRTRSEAEGFVTFPVAKSRDFARYYLDEGDALGEYKEQARALIEAWEGSSVTKHEFTLCPSGTCSALLAIAVLRALGIKRVIIETPAYFGLVEQLSVLNMKFDLIPTYRSNGYQLRNLKSFVPTSEPFAIWVTQPRASLGFNQEREAILELVALVGARGYVVIDEVTDQSFPSHLGQLRKVAPAANVIRIRSFMKGMGLNGFRLSAVIHPAHLRNTFEEYLEAFGGSLDAHSILTMKALSSDVPRFRSMLAAANAQVNKLRTRAERMTLASKITVNHLLNGYIGSMVVDVGALGRTSEERRAALLDGCRKMRTAVVLGSSFYMAKEPPLEGIRLNFFTEPEHMLRGIANVLRVVGE